MRALDERPPFAEQDEAGVTYANKIEARDRALDATRPPEEVERVVRALRPHIGARLPLPDGTFLGVLAARVDGETLAPAGGRVRTDGERLLLDCNGGALELLEIQPPGARPMPASAWLRGRPDPGLTDFWLDPRLPDRSVEELVELAVSEWDSSREWPPYLSALAWRGTQEVLEAARELALRPDPHARSAAAYVLGQLGVPERTLPELSAAALEELAAREEDPGVLATIASAFGNLGSPYGLETLLRLRRHDDTRVRDGAAGALAGRDDERVDEALIELSADPDPGIRDWATFALGTLSPRDTPELREALAARLGDEDDDTRIEAVHGLALRGDARALEAALELLGEVGPARRRRQRRRHDLEALRAPARGDPPGGAHGRPALPGPPAAARRALARHRPRGRARAGARPLREAGGRGVGRRRGAGGLGGWREGGGRGGAGEGPGGGRGGGGGHGGGGGRGGRGRRPGAPAAGRRRWRRRRRRRASGEALGGGRGPLAGAFGVGSLDNGRAAASSCADAVGSVPAGSTRLGAPSRSESSSPSRTPSPLESRWLGAVCRRSSVRLSRPSWSESARASAALCGSRPYWISQRSGSPSASESVAAARSGSRPRASPSLAPSDGRDPEAGPWSRTRVTASAAREQCAPGGPRRAAGARRRGAGLVG